MTEGAKGLNAFQNLDHIYTDIAISTDLVDFTRNVKTLPSASFNSFTKTMGLMGFIEALRLKKEGIISIISNQGAVSNELFKENLIF